MKLECGLIALKRTFNLLFVENPNTYGTERFRLEAEHLQRTIRAIIDALKAAMSYKDDILQVKALGLALKVLKYVNKNE
jgi:hypothetical protein